jgi:hypothetical protein
MRSLRWKERVTEFHNNDLGYLTWIAEHQEGLHREQLVAVTPSRTK